jgi:alkanesulfonate monooxygenase SsuD/methylene tetrahydromethanopterin reductase-like flavin-dependent oxidoreductase (luciferase family)
MSTPDRIYLALAGEAQGCRDIWLAEDLFHRGAMATAGALLSVTSKARIGLGVITPQVRQAALVAMELRALHELAEGRVMLGVGAGVKARVEAMGLKFERPSSGMVEYVAAIREWFAAEAAPEGPMSIPTFIAAIGERSMERAARSADGVLLSMMASPTHVEWAASIMSGAGNGGQVVANVPMITDSDGDAARLRAQEFVGSYMARWASMPALSKLFTGWGVLNEQEFEGVVEALAAGQPAEEVVPIEAALSHCVAGSAVDCRSQLRRYAAAGLTTAAFDPGEPSRSAADALARAIVEVYG